jgi:hypothetical protein
VSTPPIPPIIPERDYMRAHLDDLAREVTLLRAMVARQRERIGGQHSDVYSLPVLNHQRRRNEKVPVLRLP